MQAHTWIGVSDAQAFAAWRTGRGKSEDQTHRCEVRAAGWGTRSEQDQNCPAKGCHRGQQSAWQQCSRKLGLCLYLISTVSSSMRVKSFCNSAAASASCLALVLHPCEYFPVIAMHAIVTCSKLICHTGLYCKLCIGYGPICSEHWYFVYVRYGTVTHGVVWYGMVWYVWYGMVRYGMT